MSVIVTTNVPIFGICYEQHLICHNFGSKVRKGFNQEFDKTKIKLLKESPIIKDILKQVNSEVDVLMNHAGSVETIPQGFSVIASGVINQTIAIIPNEKPKIDCTQFHPEVKPTTNGGKLLSNFLDIANCEKDWTRKSFIEKLKSFIDSSVAAVLTHKPMGKQLNCIFIDTGLLRKNQTIAVLKEIPVNLFLSRFKRIADPEEKRQILKRLKLKDFKRF